MNEGGAKAAAGDTEEANDGPNPTNKSVGESHVLFEIKGSSRKEWNYVHLDAKNELRTKKDLRSTDASKAYYLLCKSYITYSKGNFDSPPKQATNSDPTADDDSTRAYEECANAVK